jgi:hypothetical protein
MKRLRRDQDCIGLVLAFALLFQALVLSVSSGAYAATLAADGNSVMCTARGAVTDRTVPGPRHKSADCCSTSCRTACGVGGGAGIIPIALRVKLPAAVEVPAEPPRAPGFTLRSAEASTAQPRAPPRA